MSKWHNDMAETIRNQYPFGLLVDKKLRESKVSVPFHFGTIPTEGEAKEWRFSTLRDRKSFKDTYPESVLGELAV